jgi:hypothetical protein
MQEIGRSATNPGPIRVTRLPDGLAPALHRRFVDTTRATMSVQHLLKRALPPSAHTEYRARAGTRQRPLRAGIFPQGLRCRAGRSLTDASPAPELPRSCAGSLACVLVRQRGHSGLRPRRCRVLGRSLCPVHRVHIPGYRSHGLLMGEGRLFITGVSFPVGSPRVHAIAVTTSTSVVDVSLRYTSVVLVGVVRSGMAGSGCGVGQQQVFPLCLDRRGDVGVVVHHGSEQ